ncbi:MAG: hypothetical protein AVDCRST_MAG54-788, partial [uncultured Actinomycetospora sp.]
LRRRRPAAGVAAGGGRELDGVRPVRAGRRGAVAPGRVRRRGAGSRRRRGPAPQPRPPRL